MWHDMGVLPPGAPDPSAVRYRRWLRQRMRSRRLVGLVVESGPRRIVASGCVWLQEVQPRPHHAGPRQAYLLSMFTEPEFRRRGLARRIVAGAIRWSRTQGPAWITLHASRKGRGLYASFGFERTWEMRLDLRPGARTRP